MSDLSEFDKARAVAQRALESHESAAIDRALSLLDWLRLTVIARLAESQLQANDVRAFRSVQLMLDGALAEFQRRFAQQVSEDIAVGVNAAANLVDAPLTAVGVNVTPLALNPASLESAQLFALDRVKGLTADARDAISGILRRIHGGAIGINDGIKEVGASLNSKGAFKSFAARAELIVRQEILTVQSQVAQARMEHRTKQLEGSGFLLLKSWLTAGDDRVREAHAQAEDDYAKDAEPGPIAIDEAFIVDGEELLYPRDINGSLDNILGCRCTSQPVLMRVSETERAKINEQYRAQRGAEVAA